MSTTLTHPSAGPGGTPLAVPLPADLAWTDEFTWQQVLQSTEYSTTGALILDAYAKQAGRPITLVGTETRGWCQRDVLNTLRGWSSQPSTTFTLDMRGMSYSVVFNHEAGALDAEALVDYADPTDDDYYVVTIRFLEL